MTPSTIEFYSKEAKLSGLPVIPFAYPTCVLVDRMKNKTKDEQILSENAKNNSAIKKKQSSEPETEVPKSPPGTLESIVGLAQQQLRAEQPFEEFDDDFFCGSLGSTPSSAQFHSIGMKHFHGVSLLKNSSKMLQNLPYFCNKKTQIVFLPFLFHNGIHCNK